MAVEPERTLSAANGQHTSGTTASYAVEPGMASDDPNELVDGIRIIQRRLPLFAGVAIATTLVMWGWTLTRTPIYRGEFRVLVEPVDNADPSRELLQDSPLPEFDYSTQIEVLRSPALLQPIAEEIQQEIPDFGLGSLSENLQINRLRDTKVLAVSYQDRNPEVIQQVLAEVSDGFLNYSFEQRQLSLQQGIQFVDDQLPELQERVDSLQQRLEQFRQQYSLLDPEQRGGELSDFISDIERQRRETQTQLTEARSLYSSLQSQLGFNAQDALVASSLSESERYQSLLSRLREVEAEIATESARFQPDSPNVIVLEDERASLIPLLEEEANRILQNFGGFGGGNGNLTPTTLELTRQLVNTANQVRQLEARRDALAQAEGQLKQEFALVPALARQYTELQRELAVATDSLNRFLTTRETLQIEAAQKSVPWELIAEPQVGGRPVSPNVPRNLLLGTLAGLAAGAIAALLTDKLDRVVHTPDDIKALTRLPILGTIPYTQDLSANGSSNGDPEHAPTRPTMRFRSPTEAMASSGTGPTGSTGGNGTTTDQQVLGGARSHYTGSPFFESFRSLSANLRYLSSDTPLRSIVISSPAAVEGKSTVALNLAAAAAEMGQRVLLVDTDLRCPQIHDRLGLPNFRGLSDLLTRDMNLRQIIQTVPDNPFLHVLTAGQIPPDPTKLLSSQRMRGLIEQFQDTFNLVIYDMPPILGFADTTLVAPHTDGIMMVVALGKTRRTDLSQAIETLRLSPIPLLGAVANGLRSKSSTGYGSYHYRYYQSHYRNSASAQPSPTRPKVPRLPGLPKPTFQRPARSQPPTAAPSSALSTPPPPPPLSASSKSRSLPLRWVLLVGVGGVIAVLWVVQLVRQWGAPAPNPLPSPVEAPERSPASQDSSPPDMPQPPASPTPTAPGPSSDFIEPAPSPVPSELDEEQLLYPVLTPSPEAEAAD